MEEINKGNTERWSEWRKFPNPQKGEYLYAPLGCGVYQLKNIRTEKFILFGKGKHLAERMTSILPPPFGTGTRNNNNKRLYVFDNLDDIVYRTIAFDDEWSAKEFEVGIKSLNKHIFNT